MKKVLFFTHLLVGGGAEKTVINLAEYINNNSKEWKATICVVHGDEKVQAELKSEVIVLKNKPNPGMKKIAKIPIVLKQASELRAIKRKYNFDTCVSFLPGSDFLNVLSKGKEKIIVSVRNKESFFVNNIFRKWYIQFCYYRAHHIVAISRRVAYDIETYFGVPRGKITAIYNPSAEFEIKNELPAWYEKLVSEKQVVITAGRLTRQKGQGYLLKAFKKAIDKNPQLHLVILGKGELENELVTLTKDLGMEDNVTFAGFVYNPYDYIARAKMFVFPSIVEGLGNVLIETLKCKTPIISSDCDCGPREILAPNTDMEYVTNTIEYAEYGVLVPVCKNNYLDCTTYSEEELLLSDAIVRLAADEELQYQYKCKAEERICDFEIGTIVNQWIKIIE